MRRQQVLGIAVAALLLCLAAFGETLKPDRVIKVTSMEHRDDKPERSFKVNAKAWENGNTSDSEPTLYYQVLCGTGAARLEIGHSYNAAEAYTKDTKLLVIFGVGTKQDSNDIVIACNVERVESASDLKH
jgi:hypothetical protein